MTLWDLDLGPVGQASLLLCMALGTGVAAADPLPLPATDFALKAKSRGGSEIDLVHSAGKMRVEVESPKGPGNMVGILDLKGNRMVMLVPNMSSKAVEIELPTDYSLGTISGAATGTRMGADQVAGQPCDLWKVDTPQDKGAGATVACITPDGIALRTETEIKGKKEVVFEAVSLTRGPQDPKAFQLPPGVQVIKVPKSAMGLPGLGGMPGR